jgi:L-rhamnose mutarotase
MSNRAKVWYIEKEHKSLFRKAASEDDETTLMVLYNEHLNMFPGIKRGDIISFYSDKKRYREDSLGVFDGEKVLTLNGEGPEYVDDYGGNIPSSFTVEEFHPMYWSEIIAHNNYIWFRPKEHNFTEMKKHVIDDYAFYLENDEYIFFFVFYDSDQEDQKKFTQECTEKFFALCKEKDVVLASWDIEDHYLVEFDDTANHEKYEEIFKDNKKKIVCINNIITFDR